MTKELIKKSIEYLLERAWENQNEARYYLEQLPHDKNSDYDETVNYFISKLEHQIKKENREYYDYYVDDLIEHYFVNQEYYEF